MMSENSKPEVVEAKIQPPKPSVGVRILAWFFIIGGALGLLTLLDPEQYSTVGSGSISKVRFSWNVVLSPFLGVIGGIYMLKLRDWARRLMIAVGVISLVFGLFHALVLLQRGEPSELEKTFIAREEKRWAAEKQEVVEKINPEYQEEELAKRRARHEDNVRYLKVSAAPLHPVSILLTLVILLFLVRPKVKEQFQ